MEELLIIKNILEDLTEKIEKLISSQESCDNCEGSNNCSYVKGYNDAIAEMQKMND